LLLADSNSDVDVAYHRDKGSSTSKPKGSRRPQPPKFHQRGSWKISTPCHPRKYPGVAIHSMPKADDEAPEKMEVATKLDRGLSRCFLVKIQNRKVPNKTSYLQLVENFFNEIKPICWIVANCHGKVGEPSVVDSEIAPRLIPYQPKICFCCLRIILFLGKVDCAMVV
ncbi:unnamed protein product, partial [Prunus brigantina]